MAVAEAIVELKELQPFFLNQGPFGSGVWCSEDESQGAEKYVQEDAGVWREAEIIHE